jgi:5'-3' exonuclease
MASFAKQFDGKVALLSQDKDLKQCLSGERVVMLIDVTWTEDETSGDLIPEYHWYTEKPHSRIACKNLLDDTGLTPEQHIEFQIIMGDSTDGIKGVVGIGEKGAADLVKEFGTVAAIIQAAKDEDERITKKKREALIEFEAKHEITRKLVTLRTDLPIPTTTKI